jgi:hypothetical protein
MANQLMHLTAWGSVFGVSFLPKMFSIDEDGTSKTNSSSPSWSNSKYFLRLGSFSLKAGMATPY